MAISQTRQRVTRQQRIESRPKHTNTLVRDAVNRRARMYMLIAERRRSVYQLFRHSLILKINTRFALLLFCFCFTLLNFSSWNIRCLNTETKYKDWDELFGKGPQLAVYLKKAVLFHLSWGPWIPESTDTSSFLSWPINSFCWPSPGIHFWA